MRKVLVFCLLISASPLCPVAFPSRMGCNIEIGTWWVGRDAMFLCYSGLLYATWHGVAPSRSRAQQYIVFWRSKVCVIWVASRGGFEGSACHEISEVHCSDRVCLAVEFSLLSWLACSWSLSSHGMHSRLDFQSVGARRRSAVEGVRLSGVVWSSTDDMAICRQSAVVCGLDPYKPWSPCSYGFVYSWDGLLS